MSYTSTSIKFLMELISRINKYLIKEKHITVADLSKLRDFLANPSKKILDGSLTMTFSTQKLLHNGTCVELTETIDINTNYYTVKSEWQEEDSGGLRTNTEYYVDGNMPEDFIPYQINYAINAIVNILKKNKGTFQIKTDKFSIHDAE